MLLHQLPTIHFEWTITAGNLVGGILAIAGGILSMVRFYVRVNTCIHRQAEENRELTKQLHAENTLRIEVIESRVNDLWDWWTRQMERRR